MTYWPFASPAVFSAAKNTPRHRIHVSHDGARHHNRERRHGSPARQTGLGEDDRIGAHSGLVVDKDDETKEPVADNGHLQHVDPHKAEEDLSGNIVAINVTRSGHMFATVTPTTLTIWQTKPTVVLACVLRSNLSLKTYGPNVNVLLRPDSQIFVLQTALGFLITYSIATDPTSRVYRTQLPSNGPGHARKHSTVGSYKAQRQHDAHAGPGEGNGIRELSLRFRMVIRVDAGIVNALALDQELIVATEKPAAVQCIRWAPDNNGSQTSTELLSRMSWLGGNNTIVDMHHDRPMNISTWITGDGKAFAIQRRSGNALPEGGNAQNLFKGYGFHLPKTKAEFGVKAAINARFSLLAVGCENGTIHVYTARDYTGNIPLSHTLRPNVASPGALRVLAYSPDGYCLFAGYESGWAMWSVYGMPGATSFGTDRHLSETNREGWLLGVMDAFWIGGGAELVMLGHDDNRIFILEMARSGITGCFSSANISRSLMQTSSGFMIYRGYDLPDLTTISADVSLWHHVQVPSHYIVDQWPIRSAVISNDGRYVAIAGRRGLAHYSVHSGRWKTFEDPFIENEFTVRGGMCWYQHVLIAAVECQDSYQIRVYSRELALDNSHIMHTQSLPAPIVLIAPSGEDSLLVYTYDNILYHYIIDVSHTTIRLVQVGQIALHGIIRAPPRVRALSWILPEHQLHNGDPSQDVAHATILFLVDAKLVLLQPTTTDGGELKYEMRIIAQNVETYALMRDHPAFALEAHEDSLPSSPSVGLGVTTMHAHDLRDSLWYFDGHDVRCWIDMQDVLTAAPVEFGRELPTPIKMPVDFYPMATLINKGIVFGVESELVQRRDTNFAFMRFGTRTHLFLPALLRHHLAQFNSPAALHLSQHYQHLLYFPHALEMLLHEVLDEEVDQPPPPEQALLPSVLSFLSSFPQYLDIVVQCTRKTELRSWRTLFANLPPPEDLFEESLQKGNLKTAGGYLLVLHTFEELGSTGDQAVRLLRRAKDEQDWDLCKELARFLMALDESGETLRRTLELVELSSPGRAATGVQPHFSSSFDPSRLGIPKGGVPKPNGLGIEGTSETWSNGTSRESSRGPSPTRNDASDYFGSNTA
ncbi:RIC1-domain-containing protein [Sporormia fimetaria CBS 119925]|uniref:RIC1-domain-containing protein n=1 Tax=Sporormia fimetaria CBS 119925 TaxID=1340428 RepID=A0A6A6VD73_9PLEO|nr:RIC1-domain-containing protein [Sporormia fimetaria CBS 119925]